MSGVLWATASGIGFGLFQSLNSRALRGIEDPSVSAFLQVAATAALGGALLAHGSLGAIRSVARDALTLELGR